MRVILILAVALTLSGCLRQPNPLPEGPSVQLVRSCYFQQLIVSLDGRFYLYRPFERPALLRIAPGVRLDDICTGPASR